MRNPTSTDFQIEPQKFLLFDQTGCPLAGGRRSYETSAPSRKVIERRTLNIQCRTPNENSLFSVLHLSLMVEI
ncbi:hypothetical protein D1AOALGA4SA_1103 [Olavius algarvensis Delta 1 endosymbiont]|nr:hypothetical protein D1AOALGA4SA_1103 [Olavius algarvensis Delta 1 endosymbiont]